MNRIILDGTVIDSREAFFAAVRSQAGEDLMPGSNLDALYDCLTSLNVHTVIEVHSESGLQQALGDYWKRVLWVINDCLDENKDLELQIHA